jgi:hypothetical protein
MPKRFSVVTFLLLMVLAGGETFSQDVSWRADYDPAGDQIAVTARLVDAGMVLLATGQASLPTAAP